MDADLFDSGQKLVDGVKNNFYAMSDARKKFGMTELQLLEESQNAQLSALDNSLANMEIVFQGDEEKILELQSYYAGLRKKVLEEYAFEKERIENASLKKTQDNLKQELSAVEESLMSQEERAEQTWQNRVDIIDQAVEAGVIPMEEGNKLIIKSTEDLDEALKTSANEMGVLGSTWSDTAKQIGYSFATMVEDMVAHLATATMAFTEAFFTFGTSAKEGESRVDKFRAASEALGVGLLGVFATTMEQVGGIIVKAGMAAFAIGEAFQEALKKPMTALGAIAAGTALILVAKGVQNSLQGLATGGIVQTGGVFKVGEQGEEMVTLPRGAAVTPNHMLNPLEDLQLSTKLSGRTIEILLDRTSAQSKRR